MNQVTYEIAVARIAERHVRARRMHRRDPWTRIRRVPAPTWE